MSPTNLTRKNCNYKALLLLVAVSVISSFLLISTESDASEWVFTPTLTTDLIFSDNVRLQPNNENKSPDFITRLAPGVESKFTSRRFESDVTYRFINIINAVNADRNRSLHNLRARNTVEVVKDLFFFDGNVTMQQQNQSILGPQGDNVNSTGNLQSIRQYKTSPYIRKRFGNFATTEIRYARIWNESDASDTFFNSQTNAYNASLISGPSVQKLQWGLNYVRQDIEFDIRPDPVRIETGIANARYNLTRTFALTGNGGYENNNFGSGLGSQTPKGERWMAGFIWVPSARTSIEASAGKRFFGDTYAFDVSYSRRLLAMSATYDETIQSARGTVNVDGTGSTTTVLTDLFTQQFPPGTDPAEIAQLVQLFISELGIPPNLAFGQTFLTNRFFLRKKAESTIALQGKKNTLLIRAFRDNRTPLDNRPELDAIIGTSQISNVKQHGANILWSLQLSPVSRFNVGGLWSKRTFPGLNRNDTIKLYTVSYSRQLSPRLFTQFLYRRNERDSDLAGADYEENRIQASLFMRF